MRNRMITALLLLALILVPMSVTAQAADTDPEIAELVQEQYEAFAASLDHTGMDELALWDMINHALYGRGKDLVFTNAGSMTAVMLNSELYRSTVTELLTAAITRMEWFGLDRMTLSGSAGWYDYQMRHQLAGYDDGGRYHGDLLESSVFTGGRNDNDIAMILVVGSAGSRITVNRSEESGDTTVYDVEFRLTDSFDFDNTYDDMEDQGFDVSLAEALTRIGKMLATGLIDEYDWCVKADFQLEIPRCCDHVGKAYEWGFFGTYPYPISVNGEPGNEAEQVTEKTENGSVEYYRLDKTVRLFHDMPWVVEFEANADSVLSLSSTADTTEGYPYLIKKAVGAFRDSKGIYYRQTVLGGDYRNVSLSKEDRYMLGTTETYRGLDVLYGSGFESRKNMGVHLYRLENRVASNGNNMVYLFVDDVEIGPLNEYHLEIRGKTFRDGNRTSNGISGMDFEINYIGDRDNPVPKGIRSLRIWETGVDEERSMIDSGSVYEPTCSEEGYYALACRSCREKYPEYYIETSDHRYGTTEKITWQVLTGAYSAVEVCSDCGEPGPAASFSCAVRPDGNGYVQIQVRDDLWEKNSMTLTKRNGSVILNIPEDDFWMQMIAVSYDGTGYMADMRILSPDETVALPLKGHTVKVLFLNRFTQAPLMEPLVVTER